MRMETTNEPIGGTLGLSFVVNGNLSKDEGKKGVWSVAHKTEKVKRIDRNRERTGTKIIGSEP